MGHYNTSTLVHGFFKRCLDLIRLPIRALRVICTQRHNATIGDVRLASNKDGTVLMTTFSGILFCSREILFLLFYMKSKKHLLKMGTGNGEMAQWAKVIVVRIEGVSSIPGTHLVEK